MQLKTILNRLQKRSAFVYQTVRLVEHPRLTLEVRVRPRRGTRATCVQCRRPAPGYDTLPLRRFDFVPLWHVPVVFVYAMRRVCCPRCGVKVEAIPWATGKHRLTDAEVDPVPRTPILLARRRSPRCRSRDRRTRRHSDSRWSSWFGPDVHRETSLGSSSRRPRRYETGSLRLIATRASAPTVCAPKNMRRFVGCAGRTGGCAKNAKFWQTRRRVYPFLSRQKLGDHVSWRSIRGERPLAYWWLDPVANVVQGRLRTCKW